MHYLEFELGEIETFEKSHYTNSGLVLCNISSEEVSKNEKFKELLELDSTLLLNNFSNLKSLIHADDLILFEKNLSVREAHSNRMFNQHIRFKKGSGKYEFLHCSAHYFDHKMNGSKRLLLNIQASNSAEILAYQAEDPALISKIIYNQSVFILTIDNKGFYTYVNDYFLKFFGWERSQVIGMSSLLGLIDEDREPCIKAAIESQLNPEKKIKIELSKIVKDEILTAQWEFIGLVDSSGKYHQTLCIGYDITELKKKQTDLIKQEALFRTLVENASDLVYLLDENFRLKYVSPSLTHILGYSEEELIGKQSFDLIKGTDYELKNTILPLIRDRASTREEIELQIFHKNGSIRWMRSNIDALYDKDGKIFGYTGISVDITDLKNKKAELQKVTRAYEHATKLAKIGNWEYDVDSGEIYWSPMVYEIHGVDTNIKPTYDDVLDLFDIENYKDQLQEAVQATLLYGKSYDLKLKTKKSNGEHIWVRATGDAFFENGFCKKVYGTLQDIGDQVEYEQKLIEAKAYAESLVKTIPDLIFIINNECRIEKWVSGNTAELIYQPEDFIGESLDQLFPVQLVKKLSDSIQKCIETNTLIHFEYELSLVEEVLYYEARLTKLNEYQVLVLCRNITKRKNAEELNKQLLMRLKNKNAALQNYNEIITHNLRSQVSNLSGIVYLMTEEFKYLRDSIYFEYMQKASDNLLQLVKQISDTNTIYLDEKMDFKSHKLTEFVDKAIENCISVLEIEKVTVINEVDSAHSILVHSPYAESIVYNLITNGIKYKNNQRKSFIKLKSSVEKDFIKLSVEDNGLGIDLEKYGKKLFGLMKTFHNHPEARGLGLFMSKNQIEAMGGKIEVDSDVNYGTTFNVFFPKVIK